jgi:hypothetical protein
LISEIRVFQSSERQSYDFHLDYRRQSAESSRAVVKAAIKGRSAAVILLVGGEPSNVPHTKGLRAQPTGFSIGAAFSGAIRTARQLKSVSLQKRAKPADCRR